MQSINEKPIVKCCLNCGNMIEVPRNNRFGDVDRLCLRTTYLITGANRDVTKVKRYTPCGKELDCVWKEKT